MPYNTRRVSLSLPSLGIHIPGQNSHRSSAHRPSPSSAPSHDGHGDHPSKRVKRTHSASTSSVSSSPDPALATSTSAAVGANTTPPPSPGSQRFAKLDKEGINDDVVVAVLEQLESTGNRPHLIKEFAAVLSHTLKVVEGSANPVAIISSRLTNYMRRPWSALAPCPLTKEQVAVHPRRVYYYLSTRPRQGIPEYTDAIAAIPANGRVISPPASVPSDDEDAVEEIIPARPASDEEQDYREREAMSPELELDDFDVPGHYHALAEPEHVVTARSRAQSPPLEYDEREFSATASSMQLRKQSEEAERKMHRASDSRSPISLDSSPAPDHMDFSVEAGPFLRDENDESAAYANRETATALFGGQSEYTHLGSAASNLDASLSFSSPLLRPVSMSGKDHLANISPRKTPFVFGAGLDDITMADTSYLSTASWDMQSPEAVGLNELDDLLGGY